jgi:hypothetical protein
VIRTTAEHPFYVCNRGWLAAGALQVGELLLSHDGRQMAIEDLLDTGEYETVYNLRIADYHTYFVGDNGWGFSVWAHNASCTIDEVKKNSWQTERPTTRRQAGIGCGVDSTGEGGEGSART